MLKIGLALGSGGAKGLAHIAVLKVFDELGVKPAVISGTSMGSLIGAMYASGVGLEKMEGMAKGLNLRKITQLIDIPLNQNKGFVKGKKIKEWLLKNVEAERFEELKIPLKIVTTDFWAKKQVILEKGDLIDAIRASISIPGIIQPYVMNGRVYVDGGLFNPVPYDIIREESDVVIAVDALHDEKGSLKEKRPNVIECLLHSYEIMYRSIERYKEEYSAPDIRINFQLEDIHILHFHKYDKITRKIREEVEVFKEKLGTLCR